jgi:transposase-like protein
MFCRETMLDFLAGSSQKIGGPNKIVEIDESKNGQRKYNRGHPFQGQCVFGGVERGSGRTFLVPVPDRTADTLTSIIREWVKPGMTVISDCWGASCDLDSLGYTHRTVNHSLYFVDPDTGDHTNTIESTSHCLRVFLGPYNKAKDYRYHLAHYMFAARCRAEVVPPFLQFLHIVASTDWSRVQLTFSSAPAT